MERKNKKGNETKLKERKRKETRADKETRERKRVSHSAGPNSAICTPDQTAELGLREHTKHTTVYTHTEQRAHQIQ